MARNRKENGRESFPRRTFGLVCLLAGLGTLATCSLLLNDDASQCHDDAGCARFPNAVCDRTAGVCVPAPPPASRTGGAAGMSIAPGTGGMPAVGGSGVGGVAATGGGPSAAGSGGNTTGHCPDLDGNGVPDCLESLVSNGDFATGISGWTPELGVSESFSPTDAQGNAQSGSLVVNNAARADASSSTTVAGVSTCVPSMFAAYDVYLQVAPAPASGGFAQAGIAVSFYSSTDCSGTATGMAPVTLLDQSVAGWRLVQEILQPDAGTGSLLVRLVVAKQASEAAAQGSFDNVLIRGR